MRRWGGGFARGWKLAWWWLRQVSGDAAYESYLKRAKARSEHAAVLSRQEFYLETLRCRYAGVTRCC